MCQSASIWVKVQIEVLLHMWKRRWFFYTVFCATGRPVHLGSPRTFLVLALKDPYSEDPLSYLMPQNHLSYSLSQNRAESSPLLQGPRRELEERPTVEVLRGKATPLPVSHPVMSFHVQSGQSPRDFRSGAQPPHFSPTAIHLLGSSYHLMDPEPPSFRLLPLPSAFPLLGSISPLNKITFLPGYLPFLGKLPQWLAANFLSPILLPLVHSSPKQKRRTKAFSLMPGWGTFW